MTGGNSHTIVFISAGVTAATVYSAAQSEEERFRALWAIGLLAVALAALSDTIPQVAGPFAVLVAVAAVARHPGALGSKLGFGPGSTTPGPAPSRPSTVRGGD